MRIYGPTVRYFEALGSTQTIFKQKCTALKALKAHTFKSQLVAECLDVLKRLTLKCTVTLRWVPGHTGVGGNKIANQLANEGSDNYFIGFEPFFGYNNTKC
jgi:ribonuclease HI